MNILLVEPDHSKDWGQYNQYHGLLKIGAYHLSKGDTVQYVQGNKKEEKQLLLFDDKEPEPAKTFDKIYIASIFSYWEKYYIENIKFYRKKYPSSEVIFGGIYAINAYSRVKKWEDEYGITVKRFFPEAVDCIPAIELLPKSDKNIASLLTSRGCPNNCTYCSVDQVYGLGWKPRDIDNVLNEIKTQSDKGIFEFALYDDNFLYKADIHAVPLLNKIVELRGDSRYKKIKFSIPSGFQASHMTQEIADLMWKANFKGRMSTSIESVDKKALKSMGRSKDVFDPTNLETCIKYMKKAGYKSRNITVYFICGLPFQTVESMIDTAVYIYKVGCYANMQRFAPIPGTVDFNRCGLDIDTIDMETTEGKKFVSSQGSTDDELKDIANFCRWINVQTMYSNTNMFSENSSIIKQGIDKTVDAYLGR